MNDPKVLRELESLRRESLLRKIDDEWHVEREQYMSSSDGGRSQAPSSGERILGVAILFAGGVYLMYSGFNAEGESRSNSLWFGGLCFLLALVLGLFQLNKANGFEAARARYEQRRREAADSKS